MLIASDRRRVTAEACDRRCARIDLGDRLGQRRLLRRARSATRGQLEVLSVSALSGIVMLLACVWISGERLLSPASAAWAATAGFAAALGLACLYQGLALGRAATVAPTAAVVTATLPAVFSAVTVGLPQPLQLAGFFVAAAGIGLVARAPGSVAGSRAGLGLALASGTGFGAFLVLIGQVESGLVFAPLAVSRTLTLVTAVALIVVRRERLPSLVGHPIALLAGMLDAGGNVLYMLARQYTRLDVAAVLSSLYPAATIVLARLISNEPVSPTQWLGAAVCLLAVALIAF